MLADIALDPKPHAGVRFALKPYHPKRTVKDGSDPAELEAGASRHVK